MATVIIAVKIDIQNIMPPPSEKKNNIGNIHK